MAPRTKAAAQQPAAAGNDSSASTRPSSRSAKAKGKLSAKPTSAPLPQHTHNVQDVVNDSPKEGAAAYTTDWQWKSLTEHSVSKHPAVFTQDARYFFVAVGASVKVYSASTGAVVSTLSAFENASTASSSTSATGGHRRTVTALMLHPSNPLQLVTSSLDGTIKIWDYLEALLLSTIDLQRPITHMCADTSKPDSVFVASSPKSKKTGRKERSMIYRVSLRSSAHTANDAHACVRVNKTQAVVSLAISPSGRWLVAAGATKIYAASVSSDDVGEFTKYNSPQPITSLAYHPTDDYFATGCENGEIRLWYCFDAERAKPEKNAQSTVLHWHAHAVASITFTPNGAYLLSGGEEAVLVIWQLDANKKDFVPRIGAAVVSIAVTPVAEQSEGYLLCLQDGTLLTIDAAKHTVRQEIPCVKFAPSHLRPPITEPVPLATHAASSCIILPASHPSSIQFYDPFTFELKSELEVAPSNRVSRTQQEYIEQTRVLAAVTCPSGRWLATIDALAEADVHLKIWSWDGKTWSLNTRVDRPHGSEKIVSLSFNPVGTDERSWQLVTVGEDANIKTWKVKTVVNERGRDELFWVSRSTFSWREQVPRSLAWSPDGSIFVVAFPASLVMFDPDSNVELQVLTCPEVKDYHSFAFVGADSQFITAVSAREVVVWDLVSGTVRWHHSTQQVIHRLVAHPSADSFLTLHHPTRKVDNDSNTIIRVFDVASGPRAVRKRLLPFPLRECAFFPLSSSFSTKKGEFTLFGISLRWSVVLTGDDVTRPIERARAIVDDGKGTGSRTLLQDIFGPSAILTAQPGPSTTPITGAGRKKEAIYELELPAYEQPPIDRLFDSLLGRIVGKRALDVPPIPDATAMDVDEPVLESGTALLESVAVEREPDKSELDTLTNMFREVFLQPAPPVPKSAHTNGNGNGVHKPASKANGHSSPKKSKSKPAAPPTPQPSIPSGDVEMDVDSSPVVGQKRKKSKVV